MPEITINTGRIDWPRYRSFVCEDEELVLHHFMELHPDLFVNSMVLFVCKHERWHPVEPGATLEPKATYRLVSVVDESALNQQPQKCNTCGREESCVSALRYHPGDLVSQQWVHGMTICWEWSCCNRVVQHGQITSHDATTGCNVGRCSSCRDLRAYRAAITKRDREEEDAF